MTSETAESNVALPAGHILVADDEEKNRRILRDMLIVFGYKVSTVEDGASALDEVAKGGVDAVLLDIMMPRMDGFEVCARLKQNPETVSIPILMLTALSGRQDRLMGIKAGADDFLTKPVDIEELLFRTKNAINMKRLRDRDRQNYAKLKDLEQLRDGLVHLVIHDMKNPVFGITGYLELLQESLKDRLKDEERRWLISMRDSSQDLLEMIRSLLDISRLEENALPVHKEACDIKEAVAKAIGVVGSMATARGVKIAVSGSPAVAQADRDLLHRIVMNLLANAVKYSSSGDTVGISTEADHTEVVATITDSGPGIPDEYKDKIFQKFGVVEGVKQGKIFSTGLGLHFCKLAVEAHGGKIGVKDGLNGKGSVFRFSLPRA